MANTPDHISAHLDEYYHSFPDQTKSKLKVEEWNNNTVADGKWLNDNTIRPLVNRDLYLAQCLDEISGRIKDYSGGRGIDLVLNSEKKTITISATTSPKYYGDNGIGFNSSTNKFYISGGNISVDKFNITSLSANKLSGNSISANDLSADSLSSINISANSISSDNISANSISSINLSSNIINTDYLSAINSISSCSLSADKLITTYVSADSATFYSCSGDYFNTSSFSANVLNINNKIYIKNDLVLYSLNGGSYVSVSSVLDTFSALYKRGGNCILNTTIGNSVKYSANNYTCCNSDSNTASFDNLTSAFYIPTESAKYINSYIIDANLDNITTAENLTNCGVQFDASSLQPYQKYSVYVESNSSTGINSKLNIGVNIIFNTAGVINLYNVPKIPTIPELSSTTNVKKLYNGVSAIYSPISQSALISIPNNLDNAGINIPISVVSSGSNDYYTTTGTISSIQGIEFYKGKDNTIYFIK